MDQADLEIFWGREIEVNLHSTSCGHVTHGGNRLTLWV